MSDELQGKFSKKIEDKLASRQRRNRVEKDVFDRNKVLNEVFDKSSVMTLSSLINDGTISYVNGVVGAGKESKTFWGVNPSGENLCIKIYLVTTSNFKKRFPYLRGDSRFDRIRKGTRSLIELWARKEFINLNQCFNAGIPCPKPIALRKNILVMGFVGENGVPSSSLIESEVSYLDYEKVIKIIFDLYNKAKLVHADLSEYNIFKTADELIVFDFGSAVDIRHPNVKEFLERDINNITKFFVKRGLTVKNPVDILERILK